MKPPGLFARLTGTYNASMRGAQITVRCDCGETGYVRTASVGVPQVRAHVEHCPDPGGRVLGDHARHAASPLQSDRAPPLHDLPIAALTPFLGIRILILLPVLMSFWFIFYMPRWRSRVREQARNLRRWKLHPE